MPNVALCPNPKLQFFDANGAPLAGGFVYTYAAGTTTPQATYADGVGATPNTNPVVLDAGGFASLWLTSATYKIVVQDLNGVVQWTQDNVSAVSLAELTGNSSFGSLTVSGAATVGGAATVDGVLTAASLSVTGAAAVGGNLTAPNSTIANNLTVGAAFSGASMALSGNATMGGTLGVTGMGTFGDLTVNGVEIDTLITSLIPALSTIGGTLIVTNIAQIGDWLVVTFGATSGTRVRVGFGAGSGLGNGASIPLPTGFTTSQLIATAALCAVNLTTGQFDQLAISVTGGVVTATASDNSGHNYTPTVSWTGFAWQTGY